MPDSPESATVDASVGVSIIVPVYNAERFLPRCVESILSQTFRGFELILVDDGSSDASPALCDGYAGADPRVRAIHKKNGGPCSARNCGIEQARGEYIGFADADDWCDPEMFRTLYQTAVKEQADLVFCDYIVEDGTGRRMQADRNGSAHYDKNRIRREILPYFFGYLPEELPAYKQMFPFADYSSYIWLCLFRRSVIRENGLWFPSQSVYYNEDNLFNLNFLLHARRAAHVPEALYHYRENTVSLTNRYNPAFLSAKLNKYEFLRSVIERFGFGPEYLTRLNGKICVESVNIINYYVNSAIPFRLKYQMIRKTVSTGVIASALRKIDLSRLSKHSPLYLVLRLEQDGSCLLLLLLSSLRRAARRLRAVRLPHAGKKPRARRA